MTGILRSLHPPARYLRQAETSYATIVEGVLSGNNMSRVCAVNGVQVYMRGDELLTEESKLQPEMRVATTDTGVVITTSWDKIMHTAASDRILSATKHLTLADATYEGVRVSHPDSAEDLLYHLEAICQCATSSAVSHGVGVDTEFDASGQNGPDRRPVLCLIGLCYTDSTHRTFIISVDMKNVNDMAPHVSSRIRAQLCGLFSGEGRLMAVFGFRQDRLALMRANLLTENAHRTLVHDLKTEPVIMARCDCADSSAAAGTP